MQQGVGLEALACGMLMTGGNASFWVGGTDGDMERSTGYSTIALWRHGGLYEIAFAGCTGVGGVEKTNGRKLE